jgi:subtilisin family serine protease
LSTVDIAVIDSGIDPSHPDLSAKLLPGYNFLNGTTDTHDVQGHGTKVAGSAAAIGNNGKGVAGVAWTNAIIPLVVVDSTGSASYSTIASAITYAVDHGIKVINISIAGSSASSSLENAVNYAWSKGAMVLAGTGNNGTSAPNYPAACTKAIAVASTNSSDSRSSFSSYGTWITIAAPGEGIYTTTNGGGYGSVSGTSFSTPIAAGVAALVFSVNPSLTNQQVKDIIIQNSDDLGSPGFDQYYGYGRINVAKSLQAAKNYVPQPDYLVPVTAITFPANGSTVGGSVTVSATASDNVGVTKVELYLNGNLIGTDSANPYSFFWDTNANADGSYQLTLKAYDLAGNIGIANETLLVSNPKDTTAPTVAITSPSAGTSISGRKSVSISTTSSDNVGVKRVEIYVDGVLKSSTTSSAALSWNWSLNKVANGQHLITSKAYDAAGNFGTTTITVTK